MLRRWWPAALFGLLLAAFAASLWGIVVHPPAYELRGEVVARPAPDLLVVRHDASLGLGMPSMELMALEGPPGLLDAAALSAGDRVRLAVRRRGEHVVLLRIERVR